MNTIEMNSITDIVFQLKWNSGVASHTEGYSGKGVNLWRDWFPGTVRSALMGRQSWEQIAVDFEPGSLFGKNGDPLTINRKQFSLDPSPGRFYPQGRLDGLAGIFPQNMTPFRCTAVNNGHMSVDLTHPLAGHPLHLAMTVGEVTSKDSERGGTSVDWIGLLTDGPGMQARWNGTPTDFFSASPFERQNDTDDSQFYGAPRLVHHLDETARDLVADLYRRFVKDGMQVLDLMSSWESHLPASVTPGGVTGLGMNPTELQQNPRLTDITVHDLNLSPTLPYADETFDTVINTASVEYLVKPFDVFAEVARVLRPGGVFAVAFSNRWFPPKVISIWEQLHEFERMGMVTEYFLESGRFTDIGTYSMRGLPRPEGDKYARELAYSDPVYAVWGTRK
jgi:SAM-dependent methyltransferase/FKBP-type peptidyl-prolyl cis-trans isomerase 2